MSEPLDFKDGVIAKRMLRDSTTGQTVELIVHQPRPDEASAHGDWICKVEIREGTESTALEGFGVDSLQALISGICALRHWQKTAGRRSLTWHGPPGELGLPLIVQEDDQDFLALIELVIAAEHSRQLVFRKRTQDKEADDVDA